ncbi:MAG TPA: enoyl-CoA hydratase-related protein [Steroidobacteraceae bacterium]|nr:enoyl-CoA hydratase-related protein [Steroidobacteraceae bacterium]
MSDEQGLIYEKDGRIARLTFNRPASLNAINASMSRQLKDALGDIDADPEVWLAILSGNGRCFCAGADVREGGQEFRQTTSRIDHYYLEAPVNWKPVIAAIHGYCYGAGLVLAAECDLIVATEDASFSIVETKLGMPAITISAQLAPWMGSKRITEMIVTGDPISADEAYRLGLVNQVVPSYEDLLPAADKLAQRILTNSPMAVRTAIQAARTSVYQSQTHRDAELIMRNTRWREWEDSKEGMRAFREKRLPQFKGR